MASQPTRMRPARAEDARLLWEWANDPLVLAMAFDPKPLPWEPYQQWFLQRLADGQSWFAILETADAQPVGQVRFDAGPEGVEMDYAIAGPFRGQGYGAALLTQAMRLARTRWSADTRVIARVLTRNPRSLELCRRAGFALTECGSDERTPYVRLERHLGTAAGDGKQ